MKNKYEVPMVQKTLRIMEAFGELRRELSLAEIMRHAEVAKASAFRILQTLQSAGYVEKSENDGTYRLGIKILQLAQIVDRHNEIRHSAVPFMMGLQKQFNESVNFGVLDNGNVLYLATVESTSSLRMARGDIAREPIHCTALGKAICAHLPWETVRSILQLKGMPRKTNRTIRQPLAFKRELEKVRERGVAFDVDEYEIGGWCVAAPVFDYTGQVVGAMSISAPRSRISGREPELAKAVRKAVDLLSARLGYTPEVKKRLSNCIA